MRHLILSLVALAILTAAAEAGAKKSARPNVLIFIADDWSWPHAGAYGDKVVKTPNIDKVAKEGVLFHRAYWVAIEATFAAQGNFSFAIAGDRNELIGIHPLYSRQRDRGWAELEFYEAMRLTPEQIETCLDAMRRVQTSGQVQLKAAQIHFPQGQALLDWVEEVKTTLKAGEFKQ